MTPRKALLHPHRKQYKNLKDYFDKVAGRPERLELNLYISGYDSEEPAQVAGNGPAMVATGTSGVGAPPPPRRFPRRRAGTDA